MVRTYQPMGDEMIWVAFFGGLIAGGVLGVLAMCLAAICKRADHPEDYPSPKGD
jgi:hypothetical protein